MRPECSIRLLVLGVALGAAATSSYATSIDSPPKPNIDLGDWDKPSAPIWMETELQEQAGKVRPTNFDDCMRELLTWSVRDKLCPSSVAISYDVTREGRAEDLQVIESIPKGLLDAMATRAVQCFKFPQAGDPADVASRTGVIFRFAPESCTAQ